MPIYNRTLGNYLQKVVLLSLLAILAGCSGSQTHLKKEEILRQARNGYYNLHSQGVRGFQASVVPNWRLTFNSPDSEKVNKAIAILSRVRFTVSFDSLGEVSIAHAPEVRQFGSDYDQIVDGAEKQIEGFFTTINPLGYLSETFPSPDSVYSTEESARGYIISSGATNGVLETDSLSKNFVISEIEIKTAGIRLAIKPKFITNSGGFLLSNIQVHEEQNEMVVDFFATLDYQDVEGVLLPKSLRLTMPALHSILECTFNDYKVAVGAKS